MQGLDHLGLRGSTSQTGARLIQARLRSSTRAAFAIAAVLLAVTAVVFPSHWYDILPRPADAPPRPFSGVTVLRGTFFLDSLIALLIAVTGWKPRGERRNSVTDWRFVDPRKPADIGHGHAMIFVALITIVGAVLRFYKAGNDLWLDEIATASVYGARPLLEIFGAYVSPGNHLLNSLLVRMTTLTFGETEWAVRLPAIVLGIATVPVVYFAARLAMSRAASVAASALLAVSYHHIFFSQNSRGYSGYILFVLLGSGLLAALLRRDRTSWWIAYVIAMALSFASLMSAAFVLAGHVLVGAGALVSRHRKGLPVAPLAQRLIIAFGAIGLLAFHIYGASLPDVLAIYPTIYNTQGSGYLFFSREFIREMVRGISAGFAFGVAAVPILIGGAAGFIVLARRSTGLAFSLALSVAVTVAYLLLRGQSVAPRLLIAGVPLAVLCVMATVDAIARSPRIALAGGSVLAAVSLLALPSYYSAPKQPYQAAIHYLERERAPGQEIVVVFPTAKPMEYYLQRDSIPYLDTYRWVETAADYARLSSSPSIDRAILVTSLFRVLRSTDPAVADRIEKEWVPVRTFRGTLGDGNITLWKRRSS